MKINTLTAFWGVCVSCFAYFLGGLNGLTLAVLVAIVFDYVCAILVAVSEGRKQGTSRINSQIGFKGIVKKLLLVACLAFAHMLDINLVGQPLAIGGLELPLFKTTFSVLFLGNECLSLTKHLKYFGVPIPQMFIDQASKWVSQGKGKPDTAPK